MATKRKDFPRGGGSILTPLEVRDINDQVMQDDTDNLDFGEEPAESTTPKRQKVVIIKPLTAKQLCVGMSLMGTVKKINQLDIVIALPNQLSGILSITEISPQITKIVEAVANDEADEIPDLKTFFVVGQPVICSIIFIENKRIDVSLLPQTLVREDLCRGMTLPCTIASKQDHGHIVSLGISGVSGFLKEKHDFQIGQVIICSISKIDDRTCFVSRDPKYVIPNSSGLELEKIRAGMMLNAKITSLTENGIHMNAMGFFDATIDYCHLGIESPSASEIEALFTPGEKSKCRVLYVNYETKQIGLTLNSSLVSLAQMDFNATKVGSVFTATVVRVEPSVGLLVKCGEHLGFVHISKIEDGHIEKIGKEYKAGTMHQARVTGLAYCDSLLQLSLQPKVLNQTYMEIEEIAVGAVVKGTIAKVDTYGAIVRLADQISGLCPTMHYSDIVLKHADRLFKVGDLATFKVLAVDAENGKLILTHKKSLINSALPIISDYESVTPGDLANGFVSAVKDFGLIVTFFNQVRAIVPKSELSYDFVADPAKLFHVGQPVKCKILSVNPAESKMRASLKVLQVTSDAENIQVGELFDSRVLHVSRDGVFASLGEKKGSAFISIAHLSDQADIAKKLHKSLVENAAADQKLPKLMIISVGTNRIEATLKRSLTSQPFISNISQLSVGDVVSAVVKNVAQNLCFVQLGSLVAVSTLQNACDQTMSNADELLKPGQSILCIITNIESETSRIFVSLKTSHMTASTKFAALELDHLVSHFESRKQFSAIRGDAPKGKRINSVVSGTVMQIMPNGITIKLSKGMVGMLSHFTNTYTVGEKIKCVIVDFDDDYANMQLREAAETSKSTKEEYIQEIIQAGSYIDGVVEISKAGYCVAVLPGDIYGICLNQTVNPTPSKLTRFSEKETIRVLPKFYIDGQLYLATAHPEAVQLPGSSVIRNAVDKSLTSITSLTANQTIKVMVQSVKGSQLNIRIADNLKGRIHACQVFGSLSEIKDKQTPLAHFKSGQIINCHVVGFHNTKTHTYLPFSHPHALGSTVVDLALPNSCPVIEIENLKVGAKYLGFIQKVDATALWVQISPTILGRVDMLEASESIDVLQNFANSFKSGSAVECFVIAINADKHTIDLSLLGRSERLSFKNIQVGSVVNGRISSISIKGCAVHLGPQVYGRVHITEISDGFSAKPTENMELGMIVKCKVLEVESEKSLITLSMRQCEIQGESITSQPKVGDLVQGYIRNISEKGCFIDLDRKTYARVKIADLSDSFIKDWKTEFPPGMLVTGKILHVDEEKHQVEMSLKKSAVDPRFEPPSLKDFKVGQSVDGTVKKLEKYGVFIRLDGFPFSGLCHISELSDHPVQNLEHLYSVGDTVRAYILKLDLEKSRISLSLKSSYFNHDMAVDQVIIAPDDDEASQICDDTESNCKEIDQDEIMEPEVLKENLYVASGSVKPLSLDFSWDAIMNTKAFEDNYIVPYEEDAEPKKRSHQMVEADIKQREDDLINGPAPELPEDFERLLLGEPNSSYIWIQYMAHQLEMTEIELARQIAERALKTINFREETEKFNVWLAFMNLENAYGTQETLEEVFTRACQMNDSKKMHIRLAQLYERTNKPQAVEIIFKKMCKKFNQSCKVWVGFAAYYMKANKSDDARLVFTRSLTSLPKRKRNAFLI